jgi:ankyrin repeat protein
MRTYFSKKAYFIFLILEIILAYKNFPQLLENSGTPYISQLTRLIINPLFYSFLYSIIFIKKIKTVGYDGFTNLMSMCSTGDFEKIKEPTENFESQINLQDKGGYTALMYACSNGNLEIVKFLLQLGANKNLQTKKGNTALYFAEKGNHSKIVELLK